MRLHEERDNLASTVTTALTEITELLDWMNTAPKFKTYKDNHEHQTYGVDLQYGAWEAIERLTKIKNNLTN